MWLKAAWILVFGHLCELKFEVRGVACRRCGKVERERLEFLAENPLYTKRFAHYDVRGSASCQRDDQGHCHGAAS